MAYSKSASFNVSCKHGSEAGSKQKALPSAITQADLVSIGIKNKDKIRSIDGESLSLELKRPILPFSVLHLCSPFAHLPFDCSAMIRLKRCVANYAARRSIHTHIVLLRTST